MTSTAWGLERRRRVRGSAPSRLWPWGTSLLIWGLLFGGSDLAAADGASSWSFGPEGFTIGAKVPFHMYYTERAFRLSTRCWGPDVMTVDAGIGLSADSEAVQAEDDAADLAPCGPRRMRADAVKNRQWIIAAAERGVAT